MAIVSKKDFAELTKTTPANISYRIKMGRLPTKDGGIDLNNPTVKEYLASRGIEFTAPPKAPARKRVRATDAEPETVDPTSLEEKNILERKKLAAQIHDLELKNAVKEGRLVAREVMIRGVWNPLETFLVRILTDGAKTMAATVHPLVKSNGTKEEVELAIRQELTSFIIPLKESIQKALKLEDV